jgi:hypothetical protein
VTDGRDPLRRQVRRRSLTFQNAQRQTVLSKDVIAAIPTAGTYNTLLVLVPTIFGGQQDVGTGPCNSRTFSAHGTLLSGGRANSEARLMLDGLSTQAGGTNYLTDTRNAQEVTLTTSSSLGEVESGGPVMNIVPRHGRQCVGKIMRVHGWRTQLSVDLYNALNSSAIQTYNQTFIVGGAWLTPTLILPARFANLTAQIDF